MSGTIKSRNWQSQSSRRKRPGRSCLVQFVMIGISLVVVTILFFSSQFPSPLSHNQQPAHESEHADKHESMNDEHKKEAKDVPASLVEYHPSIKLPNEDSFTQTMKECTSHNVKDCKQFIPDDYGNRQRIAILSPPGRGSDLFFEILQKAVLKYYDDSEEVMSRNVELIQSSHVPPYGYGKTHGLTKIIRLHHRPLLQEAAEATVSMVDEHDSMNYDGILNDQLLISNSLRQIVRWHCRLSHVAAHTLMYNINISDSTHDMNNNNVFGTGVLKAVRAIIADIGKDITAMDEDITEEKMKKVEDFVVGLELRKEEASLARKHAQGHATSRLVDTIHSKPNLLEEYQNILQDELDSTNNLKKWPCPSFHLLEEKQVAEGSLSSKLGKVLSPECDTPYTTCFVNKDKCEHRGDGLCKN